MKFTIQVLIESPDPLPLSVPIQALERSCERVEARGWRLEEAKAVLQGLQEQLVRQQLAGYLDAHRPGPAWHRLRGIKAAADGLNPPARRRALSSMTSSAGSSALRSVRPG